MLMIAERRFKPLKAPELMKRVFEGVVYVDGKEKRVDKATQPASLDLHIYMVATRVENTDEIRRALAVLA